MDSAKIGESSHLWLRTPIIGRDIQDPVQKGRFWRISDVFAPIDGHTGLRLRCLDPRGYVSFISQRDIEPLIYGLQPGTQIPWSPGQLYLSPMSEQWQGFILTARDLDDDLYLRECGLRLQAPSLGASYIIPSGTVITRLLHYGVDQDVQETLVLQRDYHAKTGYGPDTDRDQVTNRWARSSVQS